MRYDLVIFDCDGVLVDSEPISNTVLAAMLTDIGLPTTYDQSISQFLGRSWAACVKIVEGRLGRPMPDGFLESYEQRMFEAFRREIKPVLGIEAVLDSLPVPYCVASSGRFEKMNTTLGATGLLPRFEGRMFSATQVEHSKPAPDLFLFAANEMGVDPERCVVIEDSPAGVNAGISAGMAVFGYAAMTSPSALREAGAQVFDSMDDLMKLLGFEA